MDVAAILALLPQEEREEGRASRGVHGLGPGAPAEDVLNLLGPSPGGHKRKQKNKGT